MSRLADELEKRLNEAMRAYAVPGAAVGVIAGAEEVRRARGVTSVEHPLEVDDRTLFQIASNSKPFTATLVMALAEEGRVELDAPVRRYLPGFRLPGGADSDAVSVRHLLTHRVGWDGDALFVRPPAEPRLDAILGPMARARQLAAPGADWTYSNAGFSVAGRLVEVVAGAPFEQLLRGRILEPLGMSHTFLHADEVVTHRVASPHLSLPGADPVVLRRGGWQPRWELQAHDAPAAAMISCVDDLLRWLRFQLGRDTPGGAPLSPAALERMHAPQIEPMNAESGHAVGWALWHWNGHRVLNHGGLTAGYCTLTLFCRELELAAVILTNSLSGGRLHRELSRWLFGRASGGAPRDPEPAAEQPALDAYTGAFDGAFGVRTVSAVDGALEVATEAHPTDDGSWQPPADPVFRCAFYDADRAVLTDPEPMRGLLLEFGREHGRVAWLRFGGRIHTRVTPSG